MMSRHAPEQIRPRSGWGFVFAVGGSVDIISAKTIATGIISEGCSQVELAQPLNCKSKS